MKRRKRGRRRGRAGRAEVGWVTEVSAGGQMVPGEAVLNPSGRDDERVVRGAERRGKLPGSAVGLS